LRPFFPTIEQKLVGILPPIYKLTPKNMSFGTLDELPKPYGAIN
jgi:hypothetical protein